MSDRATEIEKGHLDKDGYTKPKKKKKGRQAQTVDLGAIFGGKDGFLNKGLESNWGKRKVPKEKQSDLDWIQEHGPIGNVKGDGTKATRPEIVRANQNDLDRRLNVGGDPLAVEEMKRAQAMQAGQPGIMQGDDAFKVAFGLPGTKEEGRPVGYSQPPGSGVPIAPDPRVGGLPSQNGDFTDFERGQIGQRVAEAPGALAQRQQMPLPGGQSGIAPQAQPSGVDLGAVFGQPPPPAAQPTPTGMGGLANMIKPPRPTSRSMSPYEAFMNFLGAGVNTSIP